jgi:hypothetical protein
MGWGCESIRQRVGEALKWPSWRAVALIGWSLAIVFIGLTAVQTIKLFQRGWRVEWGSMSDAFAAVGTVGALVVAGWVLLRDIATRRDAQVREQAELVTGWIEDHTRREIYDDDGNHDGWVKQANIGVINDSHGVVYDVDILLACGVPYKVRPKGTEPGLTKPVLGHFPALAPGKWSVALPLSHFTLEGAGVELYFTDARRRTWRRDANGRLHEIDSRLAVLGGTGIRRRAWKTVTVHDAVRDARNHHLVVHQLTPRRSE